MSVIFWGNISAIFRGYFGDMSGISSSYFPANFWYTKYIPPHSHPHVRGVTYTTCAQRCSCVTTANLRCAHGIIAVAAQQDCCVWTLQSYPLRLYSNEVGFNDLPENGVWFNYPGNCRDTGTPSFQPDRHEDYRGWRLSGWKTHFLKICYRKFWFFGKFDVLILIDDILLLFDDILKYVDTIWQDFGKFSHDLTGFWRR